jgi:hypothetical protein
MADDGDGFRLAIITFAVVEAAVVMLVMLYLILRR